MNLWFLPSWPLNVSQLTLFGVFLATGFIAGEAARRFIHLPRITGYALAGAALGPQGLGWLNADALLDLKPLVSLALGLVMFELGTRLDFGWLRRNQWLFRTAVLECLLTFWAIYGALVWFDFRPVLSATAAAIGTATSPAVVMLVSRELRAEGQVTDRMLLFTAVNTVFAHVVLTLLLPLLHMERDADLSMALTQPLYVFAGSLVLGAVAAWLMLRLAEWQRQGRAGQLALVVAIVVTTIGLAYSLSLSVGLALITLGLLAKNLDRAHLMVPVRLGEASQLFYLVLFILTGASLEFHVFGLAAAGAVAAFIVVRFLGKAAALMLLSPPSGLRPASAGWLAMAMLPMSGLAVVMVGDAVNLNPSFGRELAAVVLSAAMVLELIGPLATQFALRGAGEARQDG